jgi:hypothetical protein
MSQKDHPFEPRERRALRDCIRDGAGSLRSGSDVEDIIRLAVASAMRVFPAASRKHEVSVIGNAVQTTPAFEQRIVALFGD